jgi:hypothetical protein
MTSGIYSIKNKTNKCLRRGERRYNRIKVSWVAMMLSPSFLCILRIWRICLGSTHRSGTSGSRVYTCPILKQCQAAFQGSVPVPPPTTWVHHKPTGPSFTLPGLVKYCQLQHIKEFLGITVIHISFVCDFLNLWTLILVRSLLWFQFVSCRYSFRCVHTAHGSKEIKCTNLLSHRCFQVLTTPSFLKD